MPQRTIVVIGGSAGAIPALQRLLPQLPADFPAAVLVVLHLSPHSSGILPHILGRASALPASNAVHGDRIEGGHIYVAPPDRHLLIGGGGRIHIGHGPKENRFRPAIDPLFRSAALVYGPEVIGIVLSGGLDDGTAGLCAIKQAGGMAVVQDPADAEDPSMPRSALRHVAVDDCLTAENIGTMLPQLLSAPAAKEPEAMSEQTRLEVELAADERRAQNVFSFGEPSPFTCPSCSGGLVRLRDATPMRYRCHTGHAFTAVALETGLREKIEDATWTAVRALQEHAVLLKEMIARSAFSNEEVAEYSERAELAMKRAQMLRDALALTEETGTDNSTPKE